MNKVIFYGEVEQTEEQRIDTIFISSANMLADSFHLRINWENSDVKRKILDFEGQGTDEEILLFLSRLEKLIKETYGDDFEVF